MTTITNLSTTLLQEMMGTEATEAEAYAMMGILSRECVVDTDDVSESDWMAYSDEAVATAAREASE
ncbi:MAG: hypothetical protein ACK5X1_13675 [Betaproteobacteria bacterium]